MSAVANGNFVRKGRPDYVHKSERQSPKDASMPPISNGVGPDEDDGCYPTEDRPAAHRAVHDQTEAASDVADGQARPVPTAAAKASLQRHRDLASHAQQLMTLLSRRRRAGGTDGAPAPPSPEEARPLLNAIRDYCVAVNNKSKREAGSPDVSRAQVPSTDNSNNDGLNGFFAVTFLSTLFFANEAEDMLRESLQSAVDRLRAAEAHGREELYHNAVVEAVNNILLFTPLTAPPVWLIDGEPETTAASSGTVHKKQRAESVTPAATRSRASVAVDVAAKVAMQDIAAVVREMLHRIDYPKAADAHAAEHGEAGEGEATAMVLEDDCIDYLSSAGGAPSFDEQHWFDVWLSVLLEGYVHVAASVLEEDEAAAEDGAQEDPHPAAASVPALLPRPVWRSTANNAYAQFAVQLLAVFFARGSDGSLNYCARVHKLVQYYQHRLRQGGSGCVPIPTRNGTRPAPRPKTAAARPSLQQSRGLDAPVMTEKQTQTVAEAVHDEPVEEAGRASKSVMIFHPSVERSARREAAPLISEEEDEEAKLEEEQEEAPGPLSAAFSRYHKCYTADESPDFTAKKRIPVDDETHSVEDAAPADEPAAGGEQPEHTEEKQQEREYPVEDPAPAAHAENMDEEQPEEYPVEDPAPAEEPFRDASQPAEESAEPAAEDAGQPAKKDGDDDEKEY